MLCLFSLFREWYGWHFPELSKIVTDNLVYAKVVKEIGMRTNTQHCTGLSDLVPEEVEKEIRQAAEISMGTEVTQEDLENIFELVDRVIELSEYRYGPLQLVFRACAIDKMPCVCYVGDHKILLSVTKRFFSW